MWFCTFFARFQLQENNFFPTHAATAYFVLNYRRQETLSPQYPWWILASRALGVRDSRETLETTNAIFSHCTRHLFQILKLPLQNIYFKIYHCLPANTFLSDLAAGVFHVFMREEYWIVNAMLILSKGIYLFSCFSTVLTKPQ